MYLSVDTIYQSLLFLSWFNRGLLLATEPRVPSGYVEGVTLKGLQSAPWHVGWSIRIICITDDHRHTFCMFCLSVWIICITDDHIHMLVDRYGLSVLQMTTDIHFVCFVCRYGLFVLQMTTDICWLIGMDYLYYRWSQTYILYVLFVGMDYLSYRWPQTYVLFVGMDYLSYRWPQTYVLFVSMDYLSYRWPQTYVLFVVVTCPHVLFKTYHQIFNKSNMMTEAWTAYPSRACQFTPVFIGVHVA
jgi:hypothetical protein